MPEMDAQVTTRWQLGARLCGRDGYRLEIQAFDDSFRCWWAIVRWNLHFHHWRALAMNGRHLFTKVIRRKLWRP